MNGFAKIGDVCARVVKLSDADFDEAEMEATRQTQYTHPLRMGSAARTNEAGKNNLKIIEKMKELKALVEAGKGD